MSFHSYNGENLVYTYLLFKISDLETVATTKEEYMRRRSSGRIQRYFYDAKEKVKNSYLYLNNPLARRIFEDVFDNFYHRLRRDEFFAQYFDRTANNGAMCDTDGLFLCEGIWNSDSCKYGAGDSQSEHRINPYTNKEQRIVFATWNLDHRLVPFAWIKYLLDAGESFIYNNILGLKVGEYIRSPNTFHWFQFFFIACSWVPESNKCFLRLKSKESEYLRVECSY